MRYTMIVFIGIMLGFGIENYFLSPVVTATKQSLELKKQVDSLILEIELRDILLSKCKDTSYGEEPINQPPTHETNKKTDRNDLRLRSSRF